MKKKRRPQAIRTQCDWCELSRSCPDMIKFQETYLFNMFSETPPYCQKHKPVWFRGIEGVAA